MEDFLSARQGYNPSFACKSIWSSQVLLERGILWKLGDFSAFTVSEQMVLMCKDWDLELLQELFKERDTKEIARILLWNSNSKDHRVWHFAKHGMYMIKLGYRIAEDSSNIEEDIIEGNWSELWRLKIPPKVKNFLWRAGRNGLPTRTNLLGKCINVPSLCPLCDVGIENSWHLFVSCQYAQSCWEQTDFKDIINSWQTMLIHSMNDSLKCWNCSKAWKFGSSAWFCWACGSSIL